MARSLAFSGARRSSDPHPGHLRPTRPDADRPAEPSGDRADRSHRRLRRPGSGGPRLRWRCDQRTHRLHPRKPRRQRALGPLRLLPGSDRRAWAQALPLATRRLGLPEPVIVFTHVPPFGAGDLPDGEYHRGFRGYRWLLDRLPPPLWLHGPTPLADATDWQGRCGNTTVVNVTGAVVVELWSPGSVPPTRS